MLTEGTYIDHVIYGVHDVDAVAERLRREHGLGSVPGGIHLGGTTNRIVPLAPPTFLELLGIGDPTLDDGAWLSHALADGDRVLWWALGVDDLDETARRRGLPIQVGMMDMADGSRRTFRTAGMHRYPLPFFLSFEMDPEARTHLWQDRYREAGHDCEPGGHLRGGGRDARAPRCLAGRPPAAGAPRPRNDLRHPRARHRDAGGEVVIR